MNAVKAVVSHHQREIAELRADRELGTAYLKAATETLGNSEHRGGGLLALSAIKEAYGDLPVLAGDAEISTEALASATDRLQSSST
jgi:hypothetical protein